MWAAAWNLDRIARRQVVIGARRRSCGCGWGSVSGSPTLLKVSRRVAGAAAGLDEVRLIPAADHR